MVVKCQTNNMSLEADGNTQYNWLSCQVNLTVDLTNFSLTFAYSDGKTESTNLSSKTKINS